jgi:hypothetical protein
VFAASFLGVVQPELEECVVAWLEFPQLILYNACLFGCIVVAWHLMKGRHGDHGTRRVAGTFCLSALFGGMLIAVVTTPDLNPIALLWLYLPYFAFAIWALYFSVFISRGRDSWTAGRRALAWTYPSLFSAPLIVGLGLALLLAGS